MFRSKMYFTSVAFCPVADQVATVNSKGSFVRIADEKGIIGIVQHDGSRIKVSDAQGNSRFYVGGCAIVDARTGEIRIDGKATTHLRRVDVVPVSTARVKLGGCY